jgi:hypothetical protein
LSPAFARGLESTWWGDVSCAVKGLKKRERKVNTATSIFRWHLAVCKQRYHLQVFGDDFPLSKKNLGDDLPDYGTAAPIRYGLRGEMAFEFV